MLIKFYKLWSEFKLKIRLKKFLIIMSKGQEIIDNVFTALINNVTESNLENLTYINKDSIVISYPVCTRVTSPPVPPDVFSPPWVMDKSWPSE